VDPTGLPPGLHVGHVAALDAEHAWRGPLMRLPVAVVVPLQVGLPALLPSANVGRAGCILEGPEHVWQGPPMHLPVAAVVVAVVVGLPPVCCLGSAAGQAASLCVRPSEGMQLAAHPARAPSP